MHMNTGVDGHVQRHDSKGLTMCPVLLADTKCSESKRSLACCISSLVRGWCLSPGSPGLICRSALQSVVIWRHEHVQEVSAVCIRGYRHTVDILRTCRANSVLCRDHRGDAASPQSPTSLPGYSIYTDHALRTL